ncbi:MAG TPA: polysaccharide deacetylase family protein, partial [Chitinophagaceae bacterium]|nr:polysaccharide deacetylase family protein [Chitinophagaceae bacterium]
EQYCLPATFFITTGQIEQQTPYWWDELGYIIRDRELYTQHWNRLLPMPYNRQQDELSLLRASAGVMHGSHAEEMCMSADQLKALASNPLFDLGVHTVTHPALAHHDRATQQEEITNAKAWLEQLTGRRAGLLAYPYGNYDETTINIAEQQFDAAFTTEQRVITGSSGKYQSGRFQVKNWDGQEFAAQLEQWLKNGKWFNH